MPTAAVVLCATPLAGHVGPLTTVGAHLVERGYRVSMITGSRFADQVVDAGIEHRALSGVADFDERDPQSFVPDAHRYRGLRLSRYQVEHTFLRPIPAQADAVRGAIDDDTVAVLTDGTFAGVMPLLSTAAHLRPAVIGLGVMPLAQTSIDVAPFNSGLPHLAGPFGRIRNRVAHNAVRHVLFRSTQQLAADLITEAGGRLDTFVLDYSARCDRFLQLGPAEFEYPRTDLAPNTIFAGTVVPRSAPRRTPPPWWDAAMTDTRPIIHVTQGTLDNHDFTQLIEPTLHALADRNVLVVVSTGGASATDLAARAPDNARVGEYLDYDALLPRTSAVISNGGFGGVSSALRHGVPVIVAPGGEDKPEVAARVQYCGVGIDLGTRTPTPTALAAATDAVLGDTRFAAAARRMASAMSTYRPLETVEAELRAAAGLS